MNGRRPIRSHNVQELFFFATVVDIAFSLNYTFRFREMISWISRTVIMSLDFRQNWFAMKSSLLLHRKLCLLKRRGKLHKAARFWQVYRNDGETLANWIAMSDILRWFCSIFFFFFKEENCFADIHLFPKDSKSFSVQLDYLQDFDLTKCECWKQKLIIFFFSTKPKSNHIDLKSNMYFPYGVLKKAQCPWN